ncbi:MAG TPA: hypothetical protein VHL09_00005, partial [Dehalococcoidia bacterium]|nr:hypothetical protein [Dehalococcoidia bacterium]
SRRSPAQLKALLTDLATECARQGRDPAALARSMRIAIRFADAPTGVDLEGPDGAAYGLEGTADEIVRWIQAYAAAGCQMLVVETPSRDLEAVLRFVDRFRRDVMPRTQ